MLSARIHLIREDLWLPVIELDFVNQLAIVARQEIFEQTSYSAQQHQAEYYEFQNYYGGGQRSTAGVLFFLHLFVLGKSLIIESK